MSVTKAGVTEGTGVGRVGGGGRDGVDGRAAAAGEGVVLRRGAAADAGAGVDGGRTRGAGDGAEGVDDEAGGADGRAGRQARHERTTCVVRVRWKNSLSGFSCLQVRQGLKPADMAAVRGADRQKAAANQAISAVGSKRDGGEEARR